MEHSLTTPIQKDEVRKLKVGDIVYIDGRVIGIRDATQRRIVDEGIDPPIDLRNQVLLHTAPNAKKVDGKWVKICIGTTTSARMERYSPVMIGNYGVSAIVGKGGLLAGSLKAMKEYEAVYLAIVGGAAALETTQIEEIEQVYWEDLFPECLWVFRVRNFGPLIVGMDSHGNSLYERVSENARSKLARISEDLLREITL
jgi:L(+)-tartrate dehydratase beta subunit